MNLNRIIVAVDYSVASLNALQTAFKLSLESNAMLYLLHVVEVAVAMDPAIGMVSPAPEFLRREHIRRLGSLVPPELRKRLTVKKVVQSGPPANAIADFAREKDADLIVVGTHGRRGLSRLLIGSTAESLLRYAPCQVLVVKQKTTVRPSKRLVRRRRVSGGIRRRVAV